MDPLANLFTKIRNAYSVRQEEITAPLSKVARAVSDVLKKEGYVSTVESRVEEGKRPLLVMRLKYDAETTPAVERIRRVSKPGRRIYVPSDRIPRPIGGIGTIILSTPMGILSGNEAKRRGVGGEVLCEIIRGGLL